MEGFGGTLRALLDDLGLLAESLGGFGLAVLLGFGVVALLVVFRLLRR